MSAKPSLPAAVLLSMTLLVPAVPHARAQSGRGGQSPVYAQQPGAATPFSGQRAYEHVRKLVEFGPRPSGSKALEQARRYIREQVGGGLEEWVAQTPAGRLKMANVVAELKGETEDTIILASHYDTKRFKEFDFVGANDGGSSTGALIEIARALRASGGPQTLHVPLRLLRRRGGGMSRVG